jgi:hypothetical protein
MSLALSGLAVYVDAVRVGRYDPCWLAFDHDGLGALTTTILSIFSQTTFSIFNHLHDSTRSGSLKQVPFRLGKNSWRH